MALWDRVLNEELGRSSASGRIPRGSSKSRRRGSRGRDAFRGVEVTGLKELNAALGAFVPKLTKKAIRHGSREAAKLVASEARKRAPVGDADDPHYHQAGDIAAPGQLKKAIKVRALPRSRTTTGAQVTVGSSLFVGDQFYAGFQELGWMHRGRAKRGSLRGSGKKMAGQGFLRGALYDNKNRVFGGLCL